ncbi:MAG: hypothetical protein HY431_03205, partial [Candidatus Levybacteria bacterium]|nr:hypothetical protein [Candidatus Levybacteria bacterium]
QQGIRVELNDRQETLQAKIREATLQKVPFMGIIGDKEVQSSKINPSTSLRTSDQKYDEMYISVRTRGGKDEGSLALSQFLHQLQEDIDKKT